MARDGTNRGGRRVWAGAKPDPLNEKLAKGVTATRLEVPPAVSRTSSPVCGGL